jgi:nucleotide-binding universal stress UspA family protein
MGLSTLPDALSAGDPRRVTANPSADAPAVVVGHDGSPAADDALYWASAFAVRHELPLLVARAWDVDPLSLLRPAPPDSEDMRSLAGYVQWQLEGAVNNARHSTPVPTDVEVRAEQGRPSEVLAGLSRGAALLVVGRTGAGRLRALLGSTSSSALRSAHCPVAVVPAGAGLKTTGRVVVGFDGSAPARRALDWAADEAASRGASLEVVLGWQTDDMQEAVSQSLEPDGEADGPAPKDALERQARAVVDGAVAAVRERVPAATGTTERRSGSSALLRAAHRLDAAADVLVVGSRGRGGFAGLVLGSTSDQVSRHAACTVVVLRAQDDPVEPAPGAEL